MPYGKKYDSKTGKWIVYAKDTGKIKGKHETEEKANRQLAALYANVEDAEPKWKKKKKR